MITVEVGRNEVRVGLNFQFSNMELQENEFSCGSFGAHFGLQKCDVDRHLYFLSFDVECTEKATTDHPPSWPTKSDMCARKW